jgi:hypothetical protein
MRRKIPQLVVASTLLLGAILSSPAAQAVSSCTCVCRLASFCQGPDGLTTCADYRQTYC